MISDQHGYWLEWHSSVVPANRLTDIEIAVMTELPTTRQWRADQVFAIRGEGVQAVALDVRGGFAETPVQLAPSQAADVCHAFGTVSRFFPAGLTALSRFEEALWESLYGKAETVAASPLVFNDQYISTGGQFYEILQGHDRFIADLRPEAFRKLGIKSSPILSPLRCGHGFDSRGSWLCFGEARGWTIGLPIGYDVASELGCLCEPQLG
jgi:hypothetical protein